MLNSFLRKILVGLIMINYIYKCEIFNVMICRMGHSFLYYFCLSSASVRLGCDIMCLTPSAPDGVFSEGVVGQRFQRHRVFNDGIDSQASLGRLPGALCLYVNVILDDLSCD